MTTNTTVVTVAVSHVASEPTGQRDGQCRGRTPLSRPGHMYRHSGQGCCHTTCWALSWRVGVQCVGVPSSHLNHHVRSRPLPRVSSHTFLHVSASNFIGRLCHGLDTPSRVHLMYILYVMLCMSSKVWQDGYSIQVHIPLRLTQGVTHTHSMHIHKHTRTHK